MRKDHDNAQRAMVHWVYVEIRAENPISAFIIETLDKNFADDTENSAAKDAFNSVLLPLISSTEKEKLNVVPGSDDELSEFTKILLSSMDE